MYIQEQEDLDYEMTCEPNEFMAAYHTSQLQREPDDKELINILIKSGLYVVYAICPEYCPYTDAQFSTCAHRLVNVFNSLKDAKDFASKCDNLDGEIQIKVF